MVISVCNEKGGCGKTNIAINLAIKLGLLNEKLSLIDLDPQQSIEVFTSIRKNQGHKEIFSSNIATTQIKDDILNLKKEFDIVVLDTGGRDSGEMREALLISNLVIIPTTPSDVDIAVLNKMIALFNKALEINNNAKALIVISRASPNPFLAKKVSALKEYIESKNLKNIHLMDSIIYDREAYKNAFTNGLGVVEYCNENENAYKDFNSFFDELVSYVNNNL